MKKFTKGALILTLVLVVLGSVLCAVGAGIGFRYRDLGTLIKNGAFQFGNDEWAEHVFERIEQRWEERWGDYDGTDHDDYNDNSYNDNSYNDKIYNDHDYDDHDYDDYDDHDYDDHDYDEHDYDEHGNFSSAQTKNFNFSKEECAKLKNLNVDVNYGSVTVEEKKDLQGAQVEIKYRRANHEQEIEVKLEGENLNIKETGNKGLLHNDSARVTIQIPEKMEFQDVVLKSAAGAIQSNTSLNAENISIQVEAGECDMYGTLTASGKLYAEVGAGEIDLKKTESKKLELNAGVGEIKVENVQAEDVAIDCGIGSVELAMQGQEKDYSYLIDCGMGEVEIAGNRYTSLGSKKKVENGGNKVIDINCGVGEVEIQFWR